MHFISATEVEISLCAKGFFIVYFRNSVDYQKVHENDPYFWGRAGCFITPWTPKFDPLHASVTITPVWVRLLNLPLHFWSGETLRDIGNSLGKFVVADIDWAKKGLATYARICIEVDLSEGLPEQIILIWKSQKWVQHLDYENTTFRCRSYLQTGHLQGTCPSARSAKKKRSKTKSKRWDILELNDTSGSEDEDEVSIHTSKKNGLGDVMN